MQARSAEIIELPELPSLRKWQMADFDGWLVERLTARWGLEEAFWRRKLPGYTASNDYWFVTNEHSVILAMKIPHPMTAKPVIYEVFAWSRESDATNGVYAARKGTLAQISLRALYWQLREWGHSMGATRFYTHASSDMTASELKEMFGGSYYVVAAPCSFDK